MKIGYCLFTFRRSQCLLVIFYAPILLISCTTLEVSDPTSKKIQESEPIVLSAGNAFPEVKELSPSEIEVESKLPEQQTEIELKNQEEQNFSTFSSESSGDIKKRMLDKWYKFHSLYTQAYFNNSKNPELNEMPHMKAWKIYKQAVFTLSVGNRPEALRMFQEIVHQYPETYYFEEALELSQFLEEMIREDESWQEPENLEEISLPEKIQYHVYHLRNINVYQTIQPGYCHILGANFIGVDPIEKNAGVDLYKIGKETIPTLIELLHNRRPISSFGYKRDFFPSRIVLRYQDASIQILNRLIPEKFYGYGSYFSQESPEIRNQVIEKFQEWYQKNLESSSQESSPQEE